jgi:ketosteroid isomerase-like protein
MHEIDIIRAGFAAFANRDVDKALNLVTDDVELWAKVGMAHAGREHPYRGHAGVRDYFRDVAANFEGLEVEVQSARAVSGGAAVFGTVHADPAGGEHYDAPVTMMVRLRDGRIGYVRSMASLPEVRAR